MRASVLGLGLVLAIGGGTGLRAAEGLPSGSFAGTASWRGPNGSAGTYEVEKTFDGRTLTARYAWKDTAPREERHSVTFDLAGASPVFDVRNEAGEVVGRGHCFETACSYRANFGPVAVEESFQWSGEELIVLGSKSGPGFEVVWKERLRAR